MRSAAASCTGTIVIQWPSFISSLEQPRMGQKMTQFSTTKEQIHVIWRCMINTCHFYFFYHGCTFSVGHTLQGLWIVLKLCEWSPRLICCAIEHPITLKIKHQWKIHHINGYLSPLGPSEWSINNVF